MWKIIGYIAAILLAIALAVGLGTKILQKSEGYKAQGDQIFYSFEPHFLVGGCARYDAFQKPEKAEIKPIVKPVIKEVKK